jgi:hypothetical protein
MPKHKEDSQVVMVLNHLKSGAEITPLEALKKYGAYRLSDVIFKLRREGFNIVTTRTAMQTNPSGKRIQYAIYKLVEG